MRSKLVRRKQPRSQRTRLHLEPLEPRLLLDGVDITLDNSDLAPAAIVGTWTESQSVVGYIGDNYLHNERISGGSVTFAPDLPADGLYDVYMRWTSYGNRSTDVPVDIAHDGGTTTTSVNQQVNGGEWNPLGHYEFSAGTSGSVTIRTDGIGCYVVADAVRFVPASYGVIIDNVDVPAGQIQGTWISDTTRSGYHGDDYYQNGKDEGLSITYAPDVPEDGEYEVSLRWTAHGSHEATVPVAITHAGGTTNTTVNQKTNGGQWNVLGRFDFAQGASGNVTITTDGTNGTVVADAVRIARVPTVTVNRLHTRDTTPALTGTVDDPTATLTVTVDGNDFAATNNQDGTWTLADNTITPALAVGAYDVAIEAVAASGPGVSDATTGELTVVDPTQPLDMIIDNTTTSQVETTGTWQESTARQDYYGDDYLHSRSGSVTFTQSIPLSGGYNVYLRWTAHQNRAANAPVDIVHEGGTTNTTVNQEVNGGQWNLLGQFSFDEATTASVTVGTNGADGYVIADAVRIERVQSVTVNALRTADTTPQLTGTVADPWATVTLTVNGNGYSPTNNGDGTWTLADNTIGPALSLGTYNVAAQAVDAYTNSTTDATTDELVIIDPSQPTELIVDSGSPNAELIGAWTASTSIQGYYGPDYLHNSAGSRGPSEAIFTETVPYDAWWEVYLRWTSHGNRAENVPVDIEHAGGTATVTVNQEIDGGQWNLLGEYYFETTSPAVLTIRTDNTDGYVIADAVRIYRIP